MTDYEMKQLLVSIHAMMEQIVANTESAQVSSAVSSQVSAAPDSYGNPLASPISGSAQTNPQVNSEVTSGSAPDSYGNPLASPISGASPASSSYAGPSAGGGAGAGAGATYTSDPVIKSTLEQLNKALRQYRDTKTGLLDERSLQEGE